MKRISFISFYKKQGDLLEKSVEVLFNLLSEISEERYNYSFLKNTKTLSDFINRGALITICFDDNTFIGYNFSMIGDLLGNKVLIAGITQMKKHNYKIKLFYYNNLNFINLAKMLAKVEKRKLYVTTMINDGQSLEYFHQITRDTCYPFLDSSVDYESRKKYREIAKFSFEEYVKPNFPGALLHSNDFVVTSSKSKIGFNDSDRSMKHGSNLKYSVFIKAWLKKPQLEDIIFVGIIEDYSESKKEVA